MASAIRHLANQCTTCNDYAVKQQKEPLISTEVPSRPWSIVAQDLFTLNRKSYLITVDFYSDFWELDALPDTSGETIVAHTKAHFARLWDTRQSHFGQWATISLPAVRRLCTAVGL